MWISLSLALVSAAAFSGGSSPEDAEVIFVDGPRHQATLFEGVSGADTAGLNISLAPGAEDAQRFFDQGLGLVYCGWFYEAERSFQTVLLEDPDCPMAFWGLALASADVPVRAGWFARAAWLKRGLASPLEKRLIDGLATYYSVLGPDEPSDLPEVRRPEPGEEVEGETAAELAASLGSRRRPGDDASAALTAVYEGLLETAPLARALLVELALRSEPAAGRERRAEIDALLEPLFAQAAAHPALALRVRLWSGVEPPGAAVAAAEKLTEIFPEVPEAWRLAGATLERAGQREAALALLESANRLACSHARATWQDPEDVLGYAPERGGASPCPPPAAPAWSLSDAYGRTHTLAELRGKPVLVVNFLGFGCVHCVEQLQAMRPKIDLFQDQGIQVVAIGSQKPDALRVSLGDDPQATGYPFPVLCDPDLEQFRAYRAYDDFDGIALHGSYLIDGEGRLCWLDISHLPYMDIEGLAGACRKALESR